jgi:hypothetical protein
VDAYSTNHKLGQSIRTKSTFVQLVQLVQPDHLSVNDTQPRSESVSRHAAGSTMRLDPFWDAHTPPCAVCGSADGDAEVPTTLDTGISGTGTSIGFLDTFWSDIWVLG